MMRWPLVLICSASSVWAADSAEIRNSAARALALIQSSQKNWYATQKCYSCHHQLLPALAYRAAREHGIPVNESIAHEDAGQAFVFTDLDEAVQYNQVIEPAMADAFRLVAADAAGVRPNLVTAVYARVIAGRQTAAGDWPSFHQRPPASSSSFAMTALGLRSLQLYGHPSMKADIGQRVAKARGWLLSHTPRTTEDRTYQLLGLLWAGADKAAIGKAAQGLLAVQQSDGGWNSLDGRASDAYSTGEALVALHDAAGVAESDAVYRRGVEYLLKTQAPDGSWHVETRLQAPLPVSPPYFETGYPYGHDQFISTSGACWAVMALARALGPAKAVATAPIKEEAANVPGWAETVLFGSVADVDAMLGHGLGSNSATKGGTTPLMMAAPDVSKMKLLLDRGADVNARAKTGYTALMVALQYRQSTAAAALLLDHGAQVKAPAGQPKALYGAYPLFLASYAGNAEILSRLHDAGDSVEDAVTLIGTSPVAPLTGAVRNADLAMARRLVEIGAPVDQMDGSGLTPLDRAVMANQVEIAELLISKGADVNHLDKLGMTPLLWAAWVDFGDSRMADLLLQSGAKADAKAKDGLTALEAARKFHHTHLIKSLEAAR